MLASSDKGIVRILRTDHRSLSKDDAHVGMGMLVGPRTIVTCAHVINEALGLHPFSDDLASRTAVVEISFPILNDGEVYTARQVGWSSPGRDGLDCAVLELDRDAPADAGRTILSVILPNDLIGAQVSVYGSFAPGHPGAHTSAELLGDVGARWSQLEIKGRFGVQPGFSGGAVWDQKQRTAIGMLVARQTGSNGTIAYFLSAAQIAGHFGDLVPVEMRRITLISQNTFSFAAMVLFVLMLVHHLAMSGSASTFLAPWAQGSKELAAFFGAHMFAIILGPFVMIHAFMHARSFGMRKWWQRVPAAFGGRRANMLDHNWFTALMVCLFLLFLPAFGQGAALNTIFSNEPKIFVNISRFDHLRVCADPEKRDAIEQCQDIGGCSQIETNWCTHAAVSTTSFIHDWPYFNHVYQIGGGCIDGHTCKMVTFWPLLQPLVLLVMTGISYGYFILFVFCLVRPWPHAFKKRRAAS